MNNRWTSPCTVHRYQLAGFIYAACTDSHPLFTRIYLYNYIISYLGIHSARLSCIIYWPWKVGRLDSVSESQAHLPRRQGADWRGPIKKSTIFWNAPVTKGVEKENLRQPYFLGMSPDSTVHLMYFQSCCRTSWLFSQVIWKLNPMLCVRSTNHPTV